MVIWMLQMSLLQPPLLRLPLPLQRKQQIVLGHVGAVVLPLQLLHLHLLLLLVRDWMRTAVLQLLRAQEEIVLVMKQKEAMLVLPAVAVLPSVVALLW